MRGNKEEISKKGMGRKKEMEGKREEGKEGMERE